MSMRAVDCDGEDECLFCGVPCTSRRALQRSNSSDSRTGQVDQNLFAMFVVLKILEVPEQTFQDLRRTHGNPTNWIKTCMVCSRLMQEGEGMFHKILNLKQSLSKINGELRRKAQRRATIPQNKNSNGLVDNRSINQNGSNPLFQTLRSFIRAGS